MPLLTVIAGPNGAGKSTAIAQLNPSGKVVNVDDIARQLAGPSEQRNFQAARQAISLIDQLLAAGADFNFETTLSSQHALGIMREARQLGYRIELAYIVLRSVDLHIARVRQRVAQGGHDIPSEVIQRRYTRSLGNLRQAVQLADQTIVYDNTEPELNVLARKSGAHVVLNTLTLGEHLTRVISEAF